MLFQKFAPLGQIARQMRFFFSNLHDGKNKVQIGVRKRGILPARGAHPTCIALLAVGAVDIPGIGHGHGKLAYPLGAAKQLGMGYVAAGRPSEATALSPHLARLYL